jgi:DNA-binding XRE family transcriptional regulator
MGWPVLAFSLGAGYAAPTGSVVERQTTHTDATGLPGLRPARRAKGLSQEALAELTGVAGSTISHLETAVRDAHFGTVRRLAAALDVPPAQLLLGDDYPAPAPNPPPASNPTPATKRRRRS